VLCIRRSALRFTGLRAADLRPLGNEQYNDQQGDGNEIPAANFTELSPNQASTELVNGLPPTYLCVDEADVLCDHGEITVTGQQAWAIDSAPAEGVRVTPVSQIRSLFPVLKNPANRHRAVGFTPEQFH
jgi:acetyl esterase/lipase